MGPKEGWGAEKVGQMIGFQLCAVCSSFVCTVQGWETASTLPGVEGELKVGGIWREGATKNLWRGTAHPLDPAMQHLHDWR